MQDTELVVTAILCFASGGVNISTKNSYPVSVGMSVLVRGQSFIIPNFFEGGLLCLRD